MITATEIEKLIAAHKADGSPTEILELALWSLLAQKELEKISRVGWLMHFEDCEQLFWEDRECDCGVGPVNTSLQEALAKFPGGAT